MSEPLWVDANEVIGINQELLDGTPEEHVIISVELLEGALGRPRNKWYYEHEGDIAALAAELCRAVVCAHAFGQGNKRTGFVAMLLFLEYNGYKATFPDDVDTAKIVEALVKDDRAAALCTLISVLHEHCQSIEDEGVQADSPSS